MLAGLFGSEHLGRSFHLRHRWNVTSLTAAFVSQTNFQWMDLCSWSQRSDPPPPTPPPPSLAFTCCAPATCNQKHFTISAAFNEEQPLLCFVCGNVCFEVSWSRAAVYQPADKISSCCCQPPPPPPPHSLYFRVLQRNVWFFFLLLLLLTCNQHLLSPVNR